MLNRDQILAAKQKKIVTVPVPGIGDIGVRVMSGTERERWEELAFNDDGKVADGYRARLLCQTVCDDQGNRLFKDEDIAEVGELPGPAIVQLFNEAQKLNALTKDDVDELTKK